MQRTTTIHPRRPRFVAYAALLALTLFQLGFAIHQGEHAVAELGQNCALCAHYHDSDPALAPAEAVPIASPAGEALPFGQQALDYVSNRYPTRVRAPPTA